MKIYHSGMEGIKNIGKYGKINIMTTFYPFQSGKKPKLLARIRKARRQKKEKRK